MNKLTKTFAVFMALTVPAIASADIESNQVEEDEILITYNANEAATELGRTELERQIRRAAERVCGAQKMSLVGSVVQLMANRTCYEEAVEKAMISTKLTVTG